MFGNKTTPGLAVHEATFAALYFALTFICLWLFIRAFSWIVSTTLIHYLNLYPLPPLPPG